MLFGKRRAALGTTGLLGFLVTVMVTAPCSLVRAETPIDAIHAIPASVLIYPLVDSTDDHGTLITVTNIDSSSRSCGNTFTSGDICLHYVYYNNEDGNRCGEFDRFECLTPGDTLTVAADQHNPQMQEGWLLVEARDPETLLPMTFNNLIGSAIIVESETDFLWSYTPYAFRSRVEDCTGDDVLPCGTIDRCVTDVNGDNFMDFDGVELVHFPDDLLIDNFFEEGERKIFNELTLMSTKDGGITNVSAWIWNNDETRFSRSFSFECHFRERLSEISLIVEDLGGNDIEAFKSGWVRFKATAGILGVYKHERRSFGAGKELFVDGTQSVSILRSFF